MLKDSFFNRFELVVEKGKQQIALLYCQITKKSIFYWGKNDTTLVQSITAPVINNTDTSDDMYTY